jgi:hypothetical protein
VQVWQEVQRKHKNVGLVLVGSGEIDMRHCEGGLRAYVNANGLENSMRFAGRVGSSADSLEPILRPSPATSYDAEMLDVEDPDLGYDDEKFPYQ